MSSEQDFWCTAIGDRLEVRFMYPSSNSGQLVERIVQPLAYGQRIDGQQQMTVRCYQVGGASGSTSDPGVPRTFMTALMQDCTYTGATFPVPPAYTPNDQSLHVICEL